MKRLLAGTAVLALSALWVPATLAADDAAPPAKSDVAGEVARAHALRQQGDYAQAASSLAQIMMFAPDDVRVIGEYGKVMAQQNRAQDALAFLKRAVELDQNDWSLYSALGVAYDENNDPKNAATAYQHALSLKPGEPTVLNNYGMSRMLAGDLTGAQMMFAQAQGSRDPRIVNNAAMLSETIAARTPVRATPPPARPQPQQQMTAAAVQKPAPKVESAMLPPPKPTTTVASNGATGAPHAMTGAETRNNPQVVMQTVPKDPLAGPVKPKTTAHKLAAGPKRTMPEAPALRTAADTH